MVAFLVIPKVAGYSSFSVTSGSMEPAIHVGSAVVTKKEPYLNMQKGDVITFMIDEEGTLVTHRIVGINDEAKAFATKGDHNDNQDGSEVLYANVVGTVKLVIPYAGYFLVFITDTQGKIIAITAGLSILLLSFATEGMEQQDKSRTRAKLEEEDDEVYDDEI